MRVIFLALFLISFIPLCAAQDVPDIGYEIQWQGQPSDLSAYQELFIYKIDLRELSLSRADQDGDIVEEKFSAQQLEDLAFTVNESFISSLKDVVDVNQSEDDPTELMKSSKALVLDIVLTGNFRYEDQRLLMQKLNGGQEILAQPAAVTILCTLSDSQTGQALVSLSDTQTIGHWDPEVLLPEDPSNELRETLNLWAGRAANFIANQGNKSEGALLNE